VKRQRYPEEQIIGILKEAEAGVPLADLVRKHGISSASFYAWRKKYGGMEVSDFDVGPIVARLEPPTPE
jgi:putative transposase